MTKRAPTQPLPGFRAEDLPPEPSFVEAKPDMVPKKRGPKPRSPNQIREKIDRFGRPKQRYSREHVFPDGKDILIMRATQSGLWQRLPEPTADAPTSGVPRFQTRQAANAWLRGEGAKVLGGSQVAVLRALDYVLVEVLNIPTTKLVRMPRGQPMKLEPKVVEVRKAAIPGSPEETPRSGA